MATKKIVPRAAHEGGLGKESKPWGSVYTDSVVTGAITLDGDSLAQTLSDLDDDIATANGSITTLSGNVTTLSNKAVTHTGNVIDDAFSATTQATTDNSTKIATTAYVKAAIGDLINSAPATLDTLGEIAAALNNDADYVGSLATTVSQKANDSAVVHNTGNETIAGVKTFSETIVGSINNATNLKNGSYTVTVNSNGHLVLPDGSELWVA